MSNYLWILVPVLLFCLFIVGCCLCASQADADIDKICGVKVTVRHHSRFTTKVYHDRTIYCGSIEEAQEWLNSFTWVHVVSAWAEHTNGSRWEADKHGIFALLPKKRSIHA